MKKPKYIKNIEKTEGIFSIMNFHKFRTEMYKMFEEKKTPKVFEKSFIHIDGSFEWVELIYKTQQNFYLHMVNESEDETIWSLTIYYKPENLNELVIFIRQVLKQLRDDTINNGRTKAEN
jgi:hypothetical protein